MRHGLSRFFSVPVDPFASAHMLRCYPDVCLGEGHLTGGPRIFVKPAGHYTWRDDQTITVDEGTGTSTQHVIVIESADGEAAGPGVKQERSEGEVDPRRSRDIQTGAAGEPSVATEDTAPEPPRTQRSITEEEEGPDMVLVKEEGLGNPEETMVMEDNQTTPPPETTEEPAEQHRTTHSLTECAVHEDLLISGVAGDHKPWPRIRTLDQELLLFLRKSEQGPNHHHHTEHNQWTGGLNNLSPGGHQSYRGSNLGCSLQPRPFSSQSQCSDEAVLGADRPSCSYDTNTTVSMMNRAGDPKLQPSESGGRPPWW
ncbi:uncharacterized protein LOC120052982 isoform X2 [Salvelinus namaycush]|uniref:Uncharacterized protein LOC120052982 isoform X2 n=1 Tax=Salvelinus namaycush TaxID=8040 RepID=A0A8U1BN59_SALNM|nr:uncharacterized protein LOC120052982 isoform X2 [Salvelinus namaycush]